MTPVVMPTMFLGHHYSAATAAISAALRVLKPHIWFFTSSTATAKYPYLFWNLDFGLLTFDLLDTKSLEIPFVDLRSRSTSQCLVDFGANYSMINIANALAELVVNETENGVHINGMGVIIKITVDDLVRRGNPLGFLSVLANSTDAREVFVPILGGPIGAVILFMCIGIVLLVLPRSLKQVIENGMPKERPWSPFFLGLDEILCMAQLEQVTEPGYHRAAAVSRGFGDTYFDLLSMAVEKSQDLDVHVNHVSIQSGTIEISNVRATGVKNIRVNNVVIEVPHNTLQRIKIEQPPRKTHQKENTHALSAVDTFGEVALTPTMSSYAEENRLEKALANNVDPDETPHDAASHQGIQRTVQEVQVGPTYSSNIEDQDVEVTTIPPPIPKPGQAGLDTTGKEFVFFDLETRGLGI
ncbi:hypothetical protein DPMN_065119 [Dreissena polymorpha]|uniref:Uncharacterized protein n=1 Tax=Dreissena polymorpha TaxID=45954 RepID=A0A9D4HMT7_DREPO|nr:hypothetical protein DPMN_065119 [Dreissena polymorpha]